MNASEKERARRRAQDHFTRAAAAIIEPLTENVAFALLEAAAGMIALAELDASGSAKKRVDEHLAAIVSDRPTRESCPELYECLACSAKPGSPILCRGCYAARRRAGEKWIGR